MGLIRRDVAHRAQPRGAAFALQKARPPAAAAAAAAAVVRALYQYLYESPAGDPASGWISHDVAAGELYISTMANNGADMAAKLEALVPGDAIVIAGQAYTIQTATPRAFDVLFTVAERVESASNGLVTIELQGAP